MITHRDLLKDDYLHVFSGLVIWNVVTLLGVWLFGFLHNVVKAWSNHETTALSGDKT